MKIERLIVAVDTVTFSSSIKNTIYGYFEEHIKPVNKSARVSTYRGIVLFLGLTRDQYIHMIEQLRIYDYMVIDDSLILEVKSNAQ